MSGRIRIKATDKVLGNVSYLVRKEDGAPFHCILANGLSAALGYAGVTGDRMAAQFDLDDAATAEEALAAARRHGSPNYTYELLRAATPPTTAFEPLTAASDEKLSAAELLDRVRTIARDMFDNAQSNEDRRAARRLLGLANLIGNKTTGRG